VIQSGTIGSVIDFPNLIAGGILGALLSWAFFLFEGRRAAKHHLHETRTKWHLASSEIARKACRSDVSAHEVIDTIRSYPTADWRATLGSTYTDDFNALDHLETAFMFNVLDKDLKDATPVARQSAAHDFAKVALKRAQEADIAALDAIAGWQWRAEIRKHPIRSTWRRLRGGPQPGSLDRSFDR